METITLTLKLVARKTHFKEIDLKDTDHTISVAPEHKNT